MKVIFAVVTNVACIALPGVASAFLGVDYFAMENVDMLSRIAAGTTQVARLTDSNVLLTEADLDKARLSGCQPIKGDIVLIVEVRSSINGATGVDTARVTVADGRCKGQTGWVGLSRLEKLEVQQQ